MTEILESNAPSNEEEGSVNKREIEEENDSSPNAELPFRGKECRKCVGFKPLRTHHCSICGNCVMRMDHHCRKIKKFDKIPSLDQQLRRALQPALLPFDDTLRIFWNWSIHCNSCSNNLT
jgi:hypothetical protein